jgi:phosphomannomutase
VCFCVCAGYKVYWRSGHQITPPHDRGIARCIEDDLQPWAHYDATAVTDHPLCADRTAELEASYFDALGSRLCTQERRYLPHILQRFDIKTDRFPCVARLEHNNRAIRFDVTQAQPHSAAGGVQR